MDSYVKAPVRCQVEHALTKTAAKHNSDSGDLLYDEGKAAGVASLRLGNTQQCHLLKRPLLKRVVRVIQARGGVNKEALE